MGAKVFAKGREVFPIFEVRRTIETDLLLASEGHEPVVSIPSHFGVTEISNIAHEYGVAFVLGEGIAAIGAIRDRLMLPADLRLGINRY